MRTKTLAGRKVDITYCTNVHPGEAAEDLIAIVRGPFTDVVERLTNDGHQGSFGAGLRFSNTAARAFSSDAFLVEELADSLLEIDAHLLTVNAFVHGGFSRTRVKDSVYRPDWTDPERGDFTLAVADVVASLPTQAESVTISTSPGSYRPWGKAESEKIASEMARVAAGLFSLEMQFEKRIVLAVEPEPGCTFSRIDDWVRFFEEVLLRGRWPALEKLKPGNREFQEEILRRYLTVCFDACHAAVLYESPKAVLSKLKSRGIGVGKMQVSNALAIERPFDDPEAIAKLACFDEPIYLHQTAARTAAGEIVEFEDLGAFLAGARRGDFESARVHFHVPIFAAAPGNLGSTQDVLIEAIAAADAFGSTTQYEIETYSWDVLPDRDPTVADISEDIHREYTWLLERIRGK